MNKTDSYFNMRIWDMGLADTDYLNIAPLMVVEDLTVKNLAKAAGTKRKTVYRWLREEIPFPEDKKEEIVNKLFPGYTKNFVFAHWGDNTPAPAKFKVVFQSREMMGDEAAETLSCTGDYTLSAGHCTIVFYSNGEPPRYYNNDDWMLVSFTERQL